MSWLRKQDFESSRFWHHSANERSNGQEGFTAKMMGQSKGFPDLIHLGRRIALELKIKGRPATKEQMIWLRYLSDLGYFTEIVYSFERFQEIVKGRIEP